MSILLSRYNTRVRQRGSARLHNTVLYCSVNLYLVDVLLGCRFDPGHGEMRFREVACCAGRAVSCAVCGGSGELRAATALHEIQNVYHCRLEGFPDTYISVELRLSANSIGPRKAPLSASCCFPCCSAARLAYTATPGTWDDTLRSVAAIAAPSPCP